MRTMFKYESFSSRDMNKIFGLKSHELSNWRKNKNGPECYKATSKSYRYPIEPLIEWLNTKHAVERLGDIRKVEKVKKLIYRKIGLSEITLDDACDQLNKLIYKYLESLPMAPGWEMACFDDMRSFNRTLINRFWIGR